MSVLGTGIAASVAQTGLQSQQVAQQRDRTTAQSTQDAAKMRELLESHLLSLEEDAYESPANLHIDQHLPDRQTGEEPKRDKHKRPAAGAATTEAEPHDSTSAAAPVTGKV